MVRPKNLLKSQTVRGLGDDETALQVKVIDGSSEVSLFSYLLLDARKWKFI